MKFSLSKDFEKKEWITSFVNVAQMAKMHSASSLNRSLQQSNLGAAKRLTRTEGWGDWEKQSRFYERNLKILLVAKPQIKNGCEEFEEGSELHKRAMSTFHAPRRASRAGGVVARQRVGG